MATRKRSGKGLVTRRDFLVAGAMTAAAGALTACTPKIVTETVCSAPTSTVTVPATEMEYAVVAPNGKRTIPMITQAPRLDTLAGKTIAVVGGSFMASVTHPEIKRLILQNYPTAKVILLDEIGSAGAYPGPGVTSRSKDDFQKKLKEMGVQAVISGNGGCGLCTPREAGSSIAAEYISIPAVTIAAPTFVAQVYIYRRQ